MTPREDDDDKDLKEVDVSEDVLDGILDEENEDDDPLMKAEEVEDDKGWE